MQTICTTNKVPYEKCQNLKMNGVFTGIFSCRHVACEDAGRAAYSQLSLHVTGEYNRQQAGISC